MYVYTKKIVKTERIYQGILPETENFLVLTKGTPYNYTSETCLKQIFFYGPLRFYLRKFYFVSFICSLHFHKNDILNNGVVLNIKSCLNFL